MSWNTVRLGDVATFINGFPFKPSDWSNEGMEIIRIQNLTKGASETNYFKGEIPGKYKVQKGDILISWSATLDVFVWERNDAWLNQHIFKVVFDKMEIDRRFFIYLIKHILDDMKKEVHGATMQHITKGRFDNLKVPIPHLNEQKRIAEILDTANALQRKDQELLKKYDELAETIFFDMFGDPVKNERGWKTTKLNFLGDLSRGQSKHRPRNAPELLGGKYPFIQTGDVANADLFIYNYNHTYSELGLKQSKMWNKGTLCITIAANIAKTGILNIDACFPDSIVGFIPSNKTDNIFMHYWFSFFQELLEKQAPEVAQKNINLAILSNLNVITPPFEIICQFSSIIKKINEQKTIMQSTLQASEDLFLRLMQDLFKTEQMN